MSTLCLWRGFSCFYIVCLINCWPRFVHSAYHGHLTSLIDISPYKFNHKGGTGKPEGVHVVRISILPLFSFLILSFSALSFSQTLNVLLFMFSFSFFFLFLLSFFNYFILILFSFFHYFKFILHYLLSFFSSFFISFSLSFICLFMLLIFLLLPSTFFPHSFL